MVKVGDPATKIVEIAEKIKAEYDSYRSKRSYRSTTHLRGHEFINDLYHVSDKVLKTIYLFSLSL